MLRLNHSLAAAFVALAACHDEPPNSHVYASPPPPVRSPAVAPVPVVPDAPLGEKGPGAVIVSVLDAATGAPVALTDVRGIVDVMTVVALGPDKWHASGLPMRAELVISGSRDSTYVRAFGDPPPSILAHAFRIDASSLGTGHSSVKVRLVEGASRVLVESTPLFMVVADR